MKLYDENSLAKARAVANLANSAGCRLIGPITSHEREPFMSGAMNIVIIRSMMSTPYIGYA